VATLEVFLDKARSYLGTEENPPNTNRNPFAAVVGHADGQPWCATFCLAVARQVALPLPTSSAYCPRVAADFQLARQWATDNGRPGDLALFDFPDATRGIQHIGIVESVLPGQLVCIEGNTSAGVRGSQDNGGGVFRRTRPRSFVVGFGRPDFAQPVEEVKFIVEPQFNPPLPRMVAWANNPNGPGGWGLGADGGLFALGGAPFTGSAAGKSYFVNRVGAGIELSPDGRPIVVATSGERYGPTY
jgi:hypothetical protein